MNDPCKNQDLIPSEVESFQCLNESTQNGLHTESGRLIFALFHQINDNDTIDIHTSTKTLDEIKQNCEPRNQIDDPNELIGGMGDIFVKLATIEGYTNFTEFEILYSPENVIVYRCILSTTYYSMVCRFLDQITGV